VVQGNSSETVSIRQGDVLAGKYRVERVLGVGGMGVVVLARHIELDEKVALKVLLPEWLADDDAVARFAREARAMVRIKSDHVARVTDVGTLDNGAPYIVMEYLEGEDLGARLERRGVLPVDQAVDFLLQACIAVADAHAVGIVHRDLKPSNFFCIRRSDGETLIKLLDFGISRLSEATGAMSAFVTGASVMVGSPHYMAPEQMRAGANIDARTDVWALGIILFELLVGCPPYAADSMAELAFMVGNDPVPAVRRTRPDVPSGLEAVIGQCLKKDPNARYFDVAELARALLPFAPPRSTAAVERVVRILDAARPTPRPTIPMGPVPLGPIRLLPSVQPPASARTVPPPRGRTTGSWSRSIVRGAGLVASLVAGAALSTIIGGRGPRTPRPAPQATAAATAGPANPATPGPRTAMMGNAVEPPAAQSASAEARSPSTPPQPQEQAAQSSQAADAGIAVTLPRLVPLPTYVPPPTFAPPATLAPPPTHGSPTIPVVSTIPVVPAAPVQPAAPGVRAAPVQPAAVVLPPTPAPNRPPGPSLPPPKAGCNPPYVIDSLGDRQYKPECL
jgi:serine/threonine protein kinase